MTGDTHRDWLRAPLAAAELGVSRQRVHQLVASGKLRSWKPYPGTVYIHRASLDELIEARRG